MQAHTLVLPERSPLEKAAVLKAALLDYEDQLAVIEKQVRNEIEEGTSGIREAYNQTRTQRHPGHAGVGTHHQKDRR